MCLPVKPFKVEREWKAFGLSCAVVMNREASNRCGYVRVPPGHPAHGQSYNNVDVSVHGGLTFAKLEPCHEHEDGQGYWLGFDCAHYGDALYDPDAQPTTPEVRKVIAIHRRYHPTEIGHYWTQAEVESETERLAQQLAAMQEVHP